MDAHLKDIQTYAESYQTLDDAASLALIKAHLERDARMSLVTQLEITSRIPLIH